MTGGEDGNYNDLSSTEIQVTRTSKWKQVQSYPLSVRALRGATINSFVYMTGQDCPNKLTSESLSLKADSTTQIIMTIFTSMMLKLINGNPLATWRI